MRIPDRPLTGNVTTVRPATDEDADMLVGWHADPEVARYWNNRTFTLEQVVNRLRRPLVDPYIIEETGRPVGYLQAWFEDDRFELAGLDMFLLPSARGRGLGPDAARALARWLLEGHGVRRLTVDPYSSNQIAIRAWRKAGFQPTANRSPDEEHHEAWVLMVFDPVLGSPQSE